MSLFQFKKKIGLCIVLFGWAIIASSQDIKEFGYDENRRFHLWGDTSDVTYSDSDYNGIDDIRQKFFEKLTKRFTPIIYKKTHSGRPRLRAIFVHPFIAEIPVQAAYDRKLYHFTIQYWLGSWHFINVILSEPANKTGLFTEVELKKILSDTISATHLNISRIEYLNIARALIVNPQRPTKDIFKYWREADNMTLSDHLQDKKSSLVDGTSSGLVDSRIRDLINTHPFCFFLDAGTISPIPDELRNIQVPTDSLIIVPDLDELNKATSLSRSADQKIIDRNESLLSTMSFDAYYRWNQLARFIGLPEYEVSRCVRPAVPNTYKTSIAAVVEVLAQAWLFFSTFTVNSEVYIENQALWLASVIAAYPFALLPKQQLCYQPVLADNIEQPQKRSLHWSLGFIHHFKRPQIEIPILMTGLDENAELEGSVPIALTRLDSSGLFVFSGFNKIRLNEFKLNVGTVVNSAFIFEAFVGYGWKTDNISLGEGDVVLTTPIVSNKIHIRAEAKRFKQLSSGIALYRGVRVKPGKTSISPFIGTDLRFFAEKTDRITVKISDPVLLGLAPNNNQFIFDDFGWKTNWEARLITGLELQLNHKYRLQWRLSMGLQEGSFAIFAKEFHLGLGIYK